MHTTITIKKLERIEKINKVLSHYFKENPGVAEIMATKMMRNFVDSSIFRSNYQGGGPIRELLNSLERERKLHLFVPIFAVRRSSDDKWYFVRDLD